MTALRPQGLSVRPDQAPGRLRCSCPMVSHLPHAAGEHSPHTWLPTATERWATLAPTFPVGDKLCQNEGKTLCNEPFC